MQFNPPRNNQTSYTLLVNEFSIIAPLFRKFVTFSIKRFQRFDRQITIRNTSFIKMPGLVILSSWTRSFLKCRFEQVFLSSPFPFPAALPFQVDLCFLLEAMEYCDYTRWPDSNGYSTRVN